MAYYNSYNAVINWRIWGILTQKADFTNCQKCPVCNVFHCTAKSVRLNSFCT